MNIRKLEAAQRMFTAHLAGLNRLDYWQRLQQLRSYLLERRRECYLSIYIWRLINGMIPETHSLYGSKIQIIVDGRRGRQYELPRIDNRAIIAARMQLESLLSGAATFNSLPKSLREYDRVFANFKKRLDTHLKTVLDCPYLPHYPVPMLTNSLAVSTC